MKGKAADCHMSIRMIREIKVPRDRFRCVFGRLSLGHEGVFGIGRQVVSLFRRCITFYKETLAEVQAK